MSKTDRYIPRSVFMELATASAKDMYRDRKGSFAILFMFIFFYLLIIALNFMINIGGRELPVVYVDSGLSSAQKIQDELSAAGISVVSEPGKSTVRVGPDSADRSHVLVLLDSKASPKWTGVAAALERTGLTPADYFVTDDKGGSYVDILRGNMAALSCIGIMSITLMGTSVPLTRMRENGTLRLLGTTPISKIKFILAQTPARLVFALAVVLVIFATSVWLGYAHMFQLLRLVGTMFIGLMMFFALAYLIGSRTRKPDMVNNIAALLPVFALFASGAVFPTQLIPEPVTWVLSSLPTTWYVKAAGADLVGDPNGIQFYWLYLALMIVVAVISAFVAARIIVWDDRER